MTDLGDSNTGSEDVFEPVTPYQAPEVERLLQTLIDLVEAARPVPLSASSMINKEEVLEILKDVSLRLPDEILSLIHI